MDKFVDTMLQEIKKSDYNLAPQLTVEKRGRPNRVGRESLGLSVRFYSDEIADFHHVERALLRAMHKHVGLPAFLKCRHVTRRRPKNIVSVKFGSRHGEKAEWYVSNVPSLKSSRPALG